MWIYLHIRYEIKTISRLNCIPSIWWLTESGLGGHPPAHLTLHKTHSHGDAHPLKANMLTIYTDQFSQLNSLNNNHFSTRTDGMYACMNVYVHAVFTELSVRDGQDDFIH